MYVVARVDPEVSGDSNQYYLVVDTTKTNGYQVIARVLNLTLANAIRDALNPEE